MIIELMSIEDILRWAKPETELEKALMKHLQESNQRLEDFQKVCWESNFSINEPENLASILADASRDKHTVHTLMDRMGKFYFITKPFQREIALFLDDLKEIYEND
jgi:hypothetical protein